MGYSKFIQENSNNSLFTQIEHYDKLGKFLGHSTIWVSSDGKKNIYHFDDRPIHIGMSKYVLSLWNAENAFQYHPDNRGKKKKSPPVLEPKKEKKEMPFYLKLFFFLSPIILIWCYCSLDVPIFLGVLFSVTCIGITALGFKYKFFHIISPIVFLFILTEAISYPIISSYYIEYLGYTKGEIHFYFLFFNALAAVYSTRKAIKASSLKAIIIPKSAFKLLPIKVFSFLMITVLLSFGIIYISNSKEIFATSLVEKESIKIEDSLKNNDDLIAETLIKIEQWIEEVSDFIPKEIWYAVFPPYLYEETPIITTSPELEPMDSE